MLSHRLDKACIIQSPPSLAMHARMPRAAPCTCASLPYGGVVPPSHLVYVVPCSLPRPPLQAKVLKTANLMMNSYTPVGRQPMYCVAAESGPTMLPERGRPAVMISSIWSETAETWVPGSSLWCWMSLVSSAPYSSLAAGLQLPHIFSARPRPTEASAVGLMVPGLSMHASILWQQRA